MMSKFEKNLEYLNFNGKFGGLIFHGDIGL